MFGGGRGYEKFIIKNPKILKVGEEKVPTLALDKDKYVVDDFYFYAEAISEAQGGTSYNDKDEEKSEVADTEVDDDDLDMEALLAELDED